MDELKSMLAAVKVENQTMRATLKRFSTRLGDEIVHDSDSSSCSDSDIEYRLPENVVNTREMHIDNQFAKNYFFITDVNNVRLIKSINCIVYY